MNRTFNSALSAAILVLAAVTSAVSADRYGLESQFSLKTTLMPPPPLDEKKLELDVDQAIAEIMARKRDDDLIRKEVRGPERRPDLDYDVVQGIQSLNVENALRRR
jgi:hypothetical protein